MGLSNEERITGVYFAVDNLYSKAKEFREFLDTNQNNFFPKKDSKRIFELIDSLWHDIIHSNSNSIHWLVGSSASNTIREDGFGPWEIAIRHHCVKFPEVKNEFMKNLRSKDSKVFDPFDDFLNISGLLSKESHENQYYFDIFAWVEQLSYYLKRYDDEFLKKYENLSKTVSLLNGELFGIFKKNEEFAKAYVVNKICIALYTDKFPYREDEFDYVTKWMIKHNIYHHLSKVMLLELSEIVNIHLEVSKENISPFERLMIILKISSTSIHDHFIKELLELDKGILTPKEIKLIQSIFKKARTDKEKKDKDESDKYKKESKNGELFGIYDYSNLTNRGFEYHI